MKPNKWQNRSVSTFKVKLTYFRFKIVKYKTRDFNRKMKRNEFLFCLDHRWTKRWHTRRSRVCHWCFYHILTSSVIYYWIRRTATWNLFVSYNNETSSFFKIFQHNAKAGLLPRARLCPAFAGKKPFEVWSIQNEAISLVAMYSKELWLVEKNRTTVKPDSSVAPQWMKTYSESRIELRNLQILKKMLEKSSQFFCRKAWASPWKLQE